MSKSIVRSSLEPLVLKTEKKSKQIESTEIKNETLNIFLEDRPHLKIIRETSNMEWITKYFNSDVEDMWIVQCPRDLDVDQLHKQKLRLSVPKSVVQSKNGDEEFECQIDLMKSDTNLTVICPSDGLPKAISIKQSGLISIRERKTAPVQTDDFTFIGSNRVVTYPTNLKLRHPLLGAYYDKFEVKEEPIEESITPRKKSKKRSMEDLEEYQHSKKIKREHTEETLLSPKKEKKRNKERTTTENAIVKIKTEDTSSNSLIICLDEDDKSVVKIKSEPSSPEYKEMQPTKKKKKHRRD